MLLFGMSTQTETLSNGATPQGSHPNGIRGMRLLFGYSIAELARHVELKASAISRCEARGIGIGPRNWKKLADHFGVETWELHDPNLAEKKSHQFVENRNKSVAIP